MQLERLEIDLREILDNSRDPVISFSGGKDSMFLLSFSRYLGYNVPVLVFPHFWDNHQLKYIQKVVEKLNVQAFFYRPRALNYVPGTIVAHYDFGENTIPVMFDVVEGTKCGLDAGRKALKGVIPQFIWDRVIIGAKKSDAHPRMRQISFTGFSNVVTPLWNWTDEQVMIETRNMGFMYDERVYDQKDEKADTGNFVGCMACMGAKEVFCPKVGRSVQGVNNGII